jgi:hypothetical protein
MPMIEPIRGRLAAEQRLRDLHRRFRAVSRRRERAIKALSRSAKAAICVAALWAVVLTWVLIG